MLIEAQSRTYNKSLTAHSHYILVCVTRAEAPGNICSASFILTHTQKGKSISREVRALARPTSDATGN